ncbi:hypothetical protein Ciccas_003107 [Cichlidogyrus casuarinus]|uniref:Mitochondrial genome maintenance exonuclease 1 n=1 Tax=Cichlidogyrus casuarinus TaxID=1844966 RepID=A0ABD2QHP2_9PLAT
MPKESIIILARWKEKKKKELGEENFNTYVAKMKSLGQRAHEAIQSAIMHSDKAQTLDSEVEGYYNSVKYLLDVISSVVETEKDCFHPLLQYKGRFDAVICLNKSDPVLVDWKTVHEPKRVTTIERAYEAPLQLAAYVGAYNLTRPEGSPEIRKALLAYCYADGYPADRIVLQEEDLSKFWAQWLERLNIFHNQIKQTVKPKKVDAGSEN